MRTFVLVAAVLLSTACYAQENSNGEVDPAYYGMFGIGGEASWFNFSVANGFATVIDDGPFNFIRQSENGFDFDAVGAGGNMHLLLPLHDGPLGTNALHFVFGGNLASDENDSTINLGAGEFLDFLRVSGGAAFVGPGGVAVDLDANVDFRRFYAAPTLGWGSGAVTLKAGPLVEFKQYALDADFTLGGAPLATLDEDVDVWSAGPMLALMTMVPLGSRLHAFLGGQAAPLWASGDLDAHQDIAGGAAVFDQSDSANDLAFMGRGVAGVSMTAGRFVGSLYGAAEWRNDVYEIVNPRSGPGIVASTTNFDAAHLEQTDMWNLSVGLKGSLKFGGAPQ